MLNNLAIPRNLKQCIARLQHDYQRILGENLRGLYLHGSIAMGCFNPDSSDVDVLVVVQSSLSLETKQALGRVHIQRAAQCPNSLEVSVISQTVLDNFGYPTPFEFHYSDDFLEAFKEGTIDLTTPRKDPDLAAHMVITKQHGIALIGRPASDVFPDVPDDDYLDSIVQDATWCIQNMMNGADEGKCHVPKYAVLNLCRVLAFIRDSYITSKRTGAEWALNNLPDLHHTVIEAALTEYNQAGSSQAVPCDELKAFARYAQSVIRQ